MTTSGQGLIVTNYDFDGTWIGAKVLNGMYASFRSSVANKLVIRLTDDNGDPASSVTVEMTLYHIGEY